MAIGHPGGGGGAPGAARIKHARKADVLAPEDDGMADPAVAPCDKRARKSLPEISPTLVFEDPVALLDRNYRGRYAGSNAPTPTPTSVRLGLHAAVPTGPYPGAGTLSLAAGAGTVYRDALATVPLVLPLAVSNAELQAGLTLHVLGAANGALDLTLTLDPDASETFEVQGPATDQVTVVELTFEVYGYLEEVRLLTEQRRIVNGRFAPISLKPFAPRVVARQSSSPGGGRRLWLDSDAAGVQLAQGVHDRLGGSVPDQDTELLLRGTVAGGPVWVGLGLDLGGGRRLLWGDCFKAIPTGQGETSVGFEWENKSLYVDRRFAHDTFARGVLHADAWEGVPSKATVLSRAANGMKIDTEVTEPPNPFTYGEFVLGPAYEFPALETQLLALRDFKRLIEHHRKVRATIPAPIANRDGAGGNWMAANGEVALELRGRWGGTAQATVALPLFVWPLFLSKMGGAEGLAAQQAAETAAEGNRAVDDTVLGLIACAQYYIELLRGHGVIHADDGPKTATPIMFRTDFAAMYGCLTPAQAGAFDAWAAAHPDRAAQLLAGGYPEHAAGGPAIGAWLDSFSVPHHGKDRMSPPPGYPAHNTNPVIPYGMGVLGLAPISGNVIAEFRSFPPRALIDNIQGFNALCDEVFRFAADWHLPGARSWVRPQGQDYGPPAAAAAGRAPRQVRLPVVDYIAVP